MTREAAAGGGTKKAGNLPLEAGCPHPALLGILPPSGSSEAAIDLS